MHSPDAGPEMVNSPVWQLGDSKYGQWEGKVPQFWARWPREAIENQPYNKSEIKTTWPGPAGFSHAAQTS